jgi:hypothetical protein
LLVPELFRLMHEEIGAKPKGDGRQRGAIAALALAAFLIGGRAVAHRQAVALLDSRNYRGQTPLAVAAFPSASNPLLWSGLVETDNMIVSLEVSPARAFDPDASDVHFKPEPSAMLKNAAASHAGAEFLKFARFPLARVQHESDGFIIRIRDMRFAQDAPERRGLAAVIREDAQGVVTQDQIEFDADTAK